MKDMTTEVPGVTSATVHEGAKQAEEEQSCPKRWRWTEPSVWTAPMLETLEREVRGGKWFSLIDKVYNKENLRAAFKRVAANKGSPGVDHETIEHFGQRLSERLETLHERMKGQRYAPSAVRRVYIPKPGKREKRPLGIPTVTDRVVQAAVRNTIEPIFEKEFKDCSYGFRPRRSSKDALRAVTKAIEQGYRHVVDTDIQRFFDTLNHTMLMELVKRRITDGRVLTLLTQFLQQGVLEDGDLWTPDSGTPQGGVISPLLANIYLHEVDTALTEQGHCVVRYADDLVILCKTKAEAESALKKLQTMMRSLALQLHPEKTKIVDMNAPKARFTFLGYDFVTTKIDGHVRRYPNKKSRQKLRWQIRALTTRMNGNSLQTTVKRVNTSLRGWFEYFKHSSKGAFVDEDSWIRRRLRALLEHRRARRNHGLGAAHQRYSNDYFRQLGLFFLEDTRSLLLKSATR